MKHVNPMPTKFHDDATQSQHQSSKSSRLSIHTRKIWHFFVLLLMMFCTNPLKPTVFHNALGNIVETSGGSWQLIKILNRLGCVSSPDTHDRFYAQMLLITEKEVFGLIFPPIALQLLLSIISICCKVTLQFIVEISINEVIMTQQFS